MGNEGQGKELPRRVGERRRRQKTEREDLLSGIFSSISCDDAHTVRAAQKVPRKDWVAAAHGWKSREKGGHGGEKGGGGGQVYVGTSVRGAPATMCVGVGGPVGRRGEGLQGRARPRVDRGREAFFPRCGKKGTLFLLPFLLYKGGAPHGEAGWAKEE